MSSTEWMVRHIGSALLVLPVAALLAYGASFLWPLMAIPVFLAGSGSWIISELSAVLRENREGVFVEHLNLSEARQRTRFWPKNKSECWEYIFNNVASTLVGFVASVIVAGIVRVILHSGDWLTMFVVLLLWVIGTALSIARDYHRGTYDTP